MSPRDGVEKVAWVRRLGLAMLKSVEIKIGGMKIDKHCGLWLNIWGELVLPNEKIKGFAAFLGETHELTTLRGRKTSNNNEIIDRIGQFKLNISSIDTQLGV